MNSLMKQINIVLNNFNEHPRIRSVSLQMLWIINLIDQSEERILLVKEFRLIKEYFKAL